MTIRTASNATRTFLPTIVMNAAKSLELTPRICLTRKSIGTSHVLFVQSAEPRWLINNLALKPIGFTAAAATMHSLPRGVMVAPTSSELAWRRWNTRPGNGTRNVLSAVRAKTQLEPSPLSRRNTTSTAPNVTRTSLPQNASSAAKSLLREE